MKRNKWLKLLLPIVAVAVIAAVGIGVWSAAGQSGSDPVNVYPFSYIGMTEYWADSQESYGPVTTDDIQTIYLSDTQTVTQVLVEVGDTVKKGDLLMVFDTTLSDLALERERLNVEKLKLQLEDARDELNRIRNMKPMQTPQEPEMEEIQPDPGVMLTEPWQISGQFDFDGSAPERALICWLREDTEITDELLEAIRLTALARQAESVPEQTEAVEDNGETVNWFWPFFPTEPPEEPTEVPSDPTEATEPSEPAESTDPTEATDPSNPSDPDEPEGENGLFYAVIKVTRGDMSLGANQVWQGIRVRYEDGNYSMSLYNASDLPDYTLTPEEGAEPDYSEPDYGSGFTAEEIAQMRSQQEKLVRDLEFQVKMAEADYKIKQTEVDSGMVYAQIDGQVVSVLSEEEARMTMQPMLKVSGGGGYYIEGSVSELERDNLLIGQEVTVNDWNNGMTYTGTIQSIGDSPSSDGYWNGMGNPNTSYYPFTVFVDGSADLQEGYYANVMFSSATAENGVYLENPFLRTEQGRSYVYVRGEDGRLEKRYVTTGKSLWGSYTEILSGITEEDFIAFPYGKNLREGAETRESDLSELYDY